VTPVARGAFSTALARFIENDTLAAIRAGMVAVVPLTIVGGLFTIAAYPPAASLDGAVAAYREVLLVPVRATFGMIGLVACFAIAYDLGRRLRQDALSSAVMATVAFLLVQLDPAEQTLALDNLGSSGLFTAILVALVTVQVQRFFTGRGLVIAMPDGVPEIVAQSFLSLTPLFCLVILFWLIRSVAGVDLNSLVQTAFSPFVFALNTLPGILVYACLVTGLWSVGINGDNALDAIVAPIFFQYLAENVAAVTAGQPPPYVTAFGFFSTFVNVGGTGATIALALLLLRSRHAPFRKVSRMSLPTQVFQINEPIFFGLPIVLNPVFMVPYVLSALVLTTASYLLMTSGMVNKPFVNLPWTTPPVIGHYLVTGGDWRAAVWGAASIVIAMLVYLPFVRRAERHAIGAATPPLPDMTDNRATPRLTQP
jgi:cellobiose PTS system EIIC component